MVSFFNDILNGLNLVRVVHVGRTCFFEDWKFYILRFLSHIVNLALDSKQESMGLKKNSGFLFLVGLTN